MTVGELKQLVTTCKLPDETVVVTDHGGTYRILSFNGYGVLQNEPDGRKSFRHDLLSRIKRDEVSAMVLTPLR
jgi:hypothetical protein